MTAITAVTVIDSFTGSFLVVEDNPGKSLVSTRPEVRVVSPGLFSTSDINSYKTIQVGTAEELPKL
jgi:hypothetical protein